MATAQGYGSRSRNSNSNCKISMPPRPLNMSAAGVHDLDPDEAGELADTRVESPTRRHDEDDRPEVWSPAKKPRIGKIDFDKVDDDDDEAMSNG
eukprot:10041334-Heterocapsa_arctica.AAC.1